MSRSNKCIKNHYNPTVLFLSYSRRCSGTFSLRHCILRHTLQTL